jgi:CcmD family protein
MENNMGFLFAAYGAVWIVLFLYLYGLGRKQNQIAREIQKLKDKIEMSDRKEESDSSWSKGRIASITR